MSTFTRNIKKFAKEHGLVYSDDTTIGFGRPCVGLLCYDHFVEFNPTDDDFNYLPEFYDPRLEDIIPKHAYHKGNFLAVLGEDECAVAELSHWVDDLRKIGVTVQPREAPKSTFQSMTGNPIMTIRVIKNEQNTD